MERSKHVGKDRAIWSKLLNGRELLEDLDVDVRNWSGGEWTGVFTVGLGTSDMLLWTRLWARGLRKWRNIWDSWATAGFFIIIALDSYCASVFTFYSWVPRTSQDWGHWNKVGTFTWSLYNGLWFSGVLTNRPRDNSVSSCK
jgi:hypothetical protein